MLLLNKDVKSYTQDLSLHYLAFSSSPGEYYLKVDTKSGWSVLNTEGTTFWEAFLPTYRSCEPNFV